MAFSVRHFLDYLTPCLPFCLRQCTFIVEEAQLFIVSICLYPTSELLFMHSGMFEMLLIAHPMRENLGFRLFPLYFLPLFGISLIEIP